MRILIDFWRRTDSYSMISVWINAWSTIKVLVADFTLIITSMGVYLATSDRKEQIKSISGQYTWNYYIYFIPNGQGVAYTGNESAYMQKVEDRL